MFYVSEIQTTAPVVYKTPLQKSVYETLEWLQIPFERVDTDEAVTVEQGCLCWVPSDNRKAAAVLLGT